MCEICSTMLKSSAALVRHKMWIHGSDDEKYMCSDCGISCKTRKELLNHKRKHQTFDCTKCGKSFEDSTAYLTHKLFFSVAKATQEPPMSTKDVVILKQGCGYIQKDVVI